MTKTCPACRFVSTREARFCRMCGAALARDPRDHGADDSVSPAATTAPLYGARQPTDELAPHTTDSPAPGRTSRVEASELHDIFRRPDDATADSPPGANDAARRASPADEAAGSFTIRVRPLPTEGLAKDSNADAGSGAATYADDELTIAAPRAPRRNVAAPPPPAIRRAPGDARPAAPSNSAAARSPEDRALRLWGGAAVVCVALVVLACAAVALVWLAARTFRAGTDVPPPPVAAAPPATDARQAVAAKLAEADALLAAGRAAEATARLREAAALDPSNAEPHRRLAALLMRAGARRTAIEELRAALQIDESDAASWRELAASQAAEGLHADAAESYRRLLEVSNAAKGDDRIGLAYAEALRLSGQDAQARTLYRRLAASRDPQVAEKSREALGLSDRPASDNVNTQATESAAESASPKPAPTADDVERPPAATGDARPSEPNAAAESRPAATPLPAAASPKDHYERGVRLWPASRTAALAEFAAAARTGHPESNYYLGLSLAEGRDPRALRRGELLAALSYFQRARSGRFSTEARRYEDALGKEFDRRRAAGEK